MDKQNLLTIGNLSKQTGVHVKSLRYYEQLGILLPAYTDPDTGYRYYTLSQIPVVDTIRACIFLDIPLKEFTGFLTRDQRRIHYKKLFSHGTMLAHRKIRDIQEKLRLLEKFRKQMDREEDLLLHGEQAIHALPEKYCWVAPYAGKQHTPEFNILMTRIFDDIDRCQLRLGAEAGPPFLPPAAGAGAGLDLTNSAEVAVGSRGGLPYRACAPRIPTCFRQKISQLLSGGGSSNSGFFP